MPKKKTVKRFTASRAPTQETAEVQIHPAKIEIRYNGETDVSERLLNGAPGSDAAQKRHEKIAALRETYNVTLTHCDEQGNPCDEPEESGK